MAAAPVPTPIGFGPKYRLPAAPPAVERAARVAGLTCRTPIGRRDLVHVELFANKRALLMPAGIGQAPPLTFDGAYVTHSRCSYAIRTTDPTGVVEVSYGLFETLGDLFTVWGQPLTANRMAGFTGEVKAWVDGVRWRGDVRIIPLARHSEIVVEVGGYVPPHSSYLFTG